MQRARVKSIMQTHKNTALPSTNDAALESSSGSSLGLEAAVLAASWEDLDSKLDAGEQTCIFGGGSFAILLMAEQRSGIPNMTMQKMSVEFEGDISCMNSAAASHFFLLSKALPMLAFDAETALNSKSLHKLSYRLYVSDGVRVVSVGI